MTLFILLTKRAVRSTSSKVAHAADLLFGIPGCGVGSACLYSKLLLREAHTSVAAAIGANSPLTRDTIIVGVAYALTSASVTCALI